MELITILDTTLRDGEQAPGFSMDPPAKVELARALARLRVDVIEAGFAASSRADFEAVRAVAQAVGSGPDGPIIASLARCTHGDVDRSAEALAPAARQRIHVFVATSDLHLQHKLRMTREQVLEVTDAAVRRARRYTDDVEFSAEDASRTEPEYLRQVLGAAIAAGATTINVPDTVGYATPHEWGLRLADLRATVPGAGDVVFSVHCHDDLGLATANTLAALGAGARQAEVTLGGIGERAGNAALEELVMALHVRGAELGLETGIDTTQLYPAYRLLAHLTGSYAPPNKAVVGDNAFAHEAGIHQHGVLTDRRTYEIMTPASVGREGNKLVLGRHSGSHALKDALERLGFDGDAPGFQHIFERFKDLAGRKREVTEEDLVALAAGELTDTAEEPTLEYLHVVSGTGVVPAANVRLRTAAGEHTGAAVGDGPVDAACKAIEAAYGVRSRMVEWSLHAATPGKDALGEVALTLEVDGQRARGRGASTDTVEAAARAFIEALTRLGLVPIPVGEEQEVRA